MTPSILGLDLARSTGYAVMKDGAVVDVGIIELDLLGDYANFIYLTNELDELHTKYDFTEVGYEDAFRQLGRANELFQGWKWAVKVYFGARDIPLHPITPSQLMKYVTGKGSGAKHEDYVSRANWKWGLNLEISEHDKAVALFVAEYVREKRHCGN